MSSAFHTIRAAVQSGDPRQYLLETGAVTEEQWRERDIEISAEPENWGGAMDISTMDDYGTEVTDTSGADWNDPLKEL